MRCYAVMTKPFLKRAPGDFYPTVPDFCRPERRKKWAPGAGLFLFFAPGLGELTFPVSETFIWPALNDHKSDKNLHLKCSGKSEKFIIISPILKLFLSDTIVMTTLIISLIKYYTCVTVCLCVKIMPSKKWIVETRKGSGEWDNILRSRTPVFIFWCSKPNYKLKPAKWFAPDDVKITADCMFE